MNFPGTQNFRRLACRAFAPLIFLLLAPFASAQSESPQALYASTQAAISAGNYQVYLEAFVPEDRRGGLMMKWVSVSVGLALEKSMGDDDAGKKQADKALSAVMEEWRKHGMPRAPTPKFPEIGETGDVPWGEAVDRVLRDSLRETYDPLPATEIFIVDAMSVLQKTSRMTPADWFPTGPLQDLKVSGDQATGTVSYTRDDMKRIDAVNFVRRDGRWLMQGKFPSNK